MRKFLITGATDGIGQHTAKMLAKSAPAVTDKSQKRIIGIHGRNPMRIKDTMAAVYQHAPENSANFELK